MLVEVEAIVNSKPMTTETISDFKNEIPFSPANVLNMKSKVILPLSGCFSSADTYCRKCWRAAEHIANEFRSEWRKEFLYTFTAESVGEQLNILQTNFGRNDAKSFCAHSKNEKIAKLGKETFEMETLYC